jgi:hypothetical protein
MILEKGCSAKPILLYFDRARRFLIDSGYEPEIDYVQGRFFKDIDVVSLCWETTFVILASSGLKEQIVRKNFERFRDTFVRDGEDEFATIANKRQREAIRHIWENPGVILRTLRDLPGDIERIEYLDTLPQIGPISRYHLARNLGIDCIKPDIWLKRLAEAFDYSSPDEMCRDIQQSRPEFRVGTIDVILWRYCNLTGALS